MRKLHKPKRGKKVNKPTYADTIAKAYSFQQTQQTCASVAAQQSPVPQPSILESLINRQNDISDRLTMIQMRIMKIADKLNGEQPQTAGNVKDTAHPGGILDRIEWQIVHIDYICTCILEQVGRLETL
jgi:hypothetical protein